VKPKDIYIKHVGAGGDYKWILIFEFDIDKSPLYRYQLFLEYKQAKKWLNIYLSKPNRNWVPEYKVALAQKNENYRKIYPVHYNLLYGQPLAGET